MMKTARSILWQNNHLMKYLFVLQLLLVLTGCKEEKQQIIPKKEWTEEQKRKYFNDNISILEGYGLYRAGDTVETFAKFFKTHYPGIKARNYYDAFPYAMEEEYIDTTNIDTSRHWFRIIVNPSFDLPYCLIVEKKYGKSN